MMQPLHLLLSILLIINALQVQCCIEHERQALLKFRAGVADPNNQLALWSGNECCNWAGIRCANQSGHVIRLDLRNNNYSYTVYPHGQYGNLCLSGEISPFLVALSKLKYLDLSGNNFSGKFPTFLGSFENLEYLNVSYNILTGKVPPQFGNLSGLQYLDLSWNSALYTGSDISWLSRLQSLRHLDMSSVDLSYSSKEWAQSLNKLPSLEVLVLEANNLDYIPHSLSSVNFTSLTTLYLSSQYFNTTIPNWIFNLTSLITLDLWYSGFRGPIPEALGKLTSLSKLVLGYNPLDGKIPPLYNLTKLNYLDFSRISIGEHMNVTNIPNSFANKTWRRMEGLVLQECSLVGTLKGWIDQISSLKYLDLTFNNLTGPIPSAIGNNINLVAIYLSHNSFTGSLTDVHLYGLSNLETLNLEKNPISIAINENWQPSFQLRSLWLKSCKVGPKFPTWLQNQLKIEMLDLSNTQIDDNVPLWFWSLKQLTYLDMSSNKIRGKLPESIAHLGYLTSINLSNNNLTGEIPETIVALVGLTNLDLSKNDLTGKIPVQIGMMKSLQTLDLHVNNLSGEIPESISALSNLELLDVSYNNFSGTITAESPFGCSSYRGNPYLNCGVSWGNYTNWNTNSDSDSNFSSNPNTSGNGKAKLWLYLSIEIGFVIGFQIAIYTLLFIKDWRYTFFQSIDRMFDKLYVSGALILKAEKRTWL